MTQTAQNLGRRLDDFYRDAQANHLAPLWPVTAQLLTAEPKTKVKPFMWRGSELRRLMLEAGELVPLESSGTSSPRHRGYRAGSKRFRNGQDH
jgi:gentisate 1,2-dioxygenase